MSFPTKQLHTLGGHNGQVHALCYSSGDSTYLLTGSTDRTVRLFNPLKGTLIQKYTGAHGYEVLDIAVNRENTHFASVGGDKLVFLWDVTAARTLRRWEGHTGRVNAVRFAGEAESVVVSGGFDATVKIWDGKSNALKPIMTLMEARDAISAIEVAGTDIIAASVDGRVRTYDIRNGRCFVDVIGQSVTSLACTMEGETLLTSSLDSTLRLFDRRDGRLLQTFKDPGFLNENYRIRAALGMHDSFVISGSEEGSIFVWEFVNGQVLHRLSHAGGATAGGAAGNKKKDVVSAVAYCPGRRKEWCSAGANGNVVVWGCEEIT